MGWKTLKFDCIDDYRIVEFGGLTFKPQSSDRRRVFVFTGFSYLCELLAKCSTLEMVEAKLQMRDRKKKAGDYVSRPSFFRQRREESHVDKLRVAGYG